MFALRQKSRAILRITTSICGAKSWARWPIGSGSHNRRWFGETTRRLALMPYLLADIGEGITECQIVSWAVKPGDKVEQFDPICEVQSDKASVEITSRYEGMINKLHYEVGDVAKVGSALLDIDTVGDDSDATAVSEPVVDIDGEKSTKTETGWQQQLGQEPASSISATSSTTDTKAQPGPSRGNGSSAIMAPAVRRMIKENHIDISDVKGTGKEGRILKEDILKYITAQANAPQRAWQLNNQFAPATANIGTEDRTVALSPVQSQMFKSMTASLAIPHFLYTHTVDLTSLTRLRQHFQGDPSTASYLTNGDGTAIKLTLLPFVLKALSHAINEFPIINSALETGDSDVGQQPKLILRGSHNIGLAVDTPNGLLVPVVRNVQNFSVISLAAEISRLSKLAREGKLRPEDLTDATIVVSNIGSIGGNVVAPVILSPMTAIVAVGRTENVPAFETGDDGRERLVKRQQTTLSWSADHRILDGATVARCAQQVSKWLENPEYLGIALK